MADRAAWAPLSAVYDPLQVGSIDGTDVEPHDQGVVRAMNAKYHPNKNVKGDPKRMIFLGRLNAQTTEQTIREVMSKYGEITNLRLVRDIVTGFSKCYAFVEYSNELDARRVYREYNRLTIDDSQVYVDFELERTLKGWVPRRFGGGFGGRKESGQLRFGGRDRPFRKPIITENPERYVNNQNSERYADKRRDFGNYRDFQDDQSRSNYRDDRHRNTDRRRYHAKSSRRSKSRSRSRSRERYRSKHKQRRD